MTKHFTPGKGDIIALTFDPQAGHEQRGWRPALVVSNTLFNEHTGLAMVCPVTSTDKGRPLQVRIPGGCSTTGVVMVEQMRSVDFTARHARLVEKAPEQLLEEVLAILDACLFD